MSARWVTGISVAAIGTLLYVAATHDALGVRLTCAMLIFVRYVTVESLRGKS